MTKTHYEITAAGGCVFNVHLIDDDPDLPIGDAREFLGSVKAGDIDEDGQWVGDEDDVLAAATEGPGCPVHDDGLPVFVDGVQARRDDR